MNKTGGYPNGYTIGFNMANVLHDEGPYNENISSKPGPYIAMTDNTIYTYIVCGMCQL